MTHSTMPEPAGQRDAHVQVLTAEVRTLMVGPAMTTSLETKAEKRARLSALGYSQATQPTKCCLCGKQIAPGQFVGKMPASWNVSSARRWAHYRCIEQLREEIRAKAAAAGVVVPAAGSVAHG
jgi:hypothetical protein